MKFKMWLEVQDRDLDEKRVQLYQAVMRELRATQDDLGTDLSRIPGVHQPQGGQPPTNGRGSLQVVHDKLNTILSQMAGDNSDPEQQTRAERTRKWLQGSQESDVKIHAAVPCLQDLLRELFGNDFREKLVDRKPPNSDNTPMPPPQDDNTPPQPPQDANVPPPQNAPDPNAQPMMVPQQSGVPGQMPSMPPQPVGKKPGGPFGEWMQRRSLQIT